MTRHGSLARQGLGGPETALAAVPRRLSRGFFHGNRRLCRRLYPELGKADPAHFGISLATLDGHIYEVGDSRIPFTIQSMSKPFVFALALDTLGAARVESAIGVEPTGEHSIRSCSTRTTGRSIRWSTPAPSPAPALIKGQARRRVRNLRCGVQPLLRPGGLRRRHGIMSERVTGHRNRAIGYLMLNFGIVKATSAACSRSISSNAPSW